MSSGRAVLVNYTLEQRPGGLSSVHGGGATVAEVFDLAGNIIECPPARSILDAYAISVHIEDGVRAALICQNCPTMYCECGDSDDRAAKMMVALWMEPLIRSTVFEPAGVVVFCGGATVV